MARDRPLQEVRLVGNSSSGSEEVSLRGDGASYSGAKLEPVDSSAFRVAKTAPRVDQDWQQRAKPS